jgi:hypothetical protein
VEALAVYHWLRQRRSAATDLHGLGGETSLTSALTDAPAQRPSDDPVPILPIRLWQEVALLFAATAPTEPDHRVGMLEQGAGSKWQWLPLVGGDFPLPTYAQRGPLIAWTPHLAGVALKMDRPSLDAPRTRGKGQRWEAPAIAGALLALVLLTTINLWATLHGNRATESTSAPKTADAPAAESHAPVTHNPDQARQAFAGALHLLLTEHGGQPEWDTIREQLLARYDRAARENKDLRLPETDVKGRTAVGYVLLLNERSARRIEDTIKKALSNRGFDAELVNVACQRVREQLLEEARISP